jgi:Cu-Zn family superoxide dismutase
MKTSFAAFLPLLLAACSGGAPETETAESEDDLTFAAGDTWTVFANPFGDGKPNPAEKIVGKVRMKVSPELDGSMVSLTAYGLPANTTFGAHAHAKACADTQGGGHYQHAPGQIDASSEVWLDFKTNGNGAGRAEVRKPFPLRVEEVKSVVVHAQATDPATGKAGPKLACIDVKVTDQINFLNGRVWTAFADPFKDGRPNPAVGVAGAASVVAWEQKSVSAVGLYVVGLPKNTTFGAHLHALPCGDTQGGGHYQHTPGTVNDVSEVWLDFTTDASGRAIKGVTKQVALRVAQARSIVIHEKATDPATGKAGAKLACVDLGPLKL